MRTADYEDFITQTPSYNDKSANYFCPGSDYNQKVIVTVGVKKGERYRSWWS